MGKPEAEVSRATNVDAMSLGVSLDDTLSPF